MLRVYNGYDPREAIGTWVWQHSVLKRTTTPIEFVNLDKRTLGSVYPNLFAQNGTNQFAFSRFACADLSGNSGGPVIFADGADMICLTDLSTILNEVEFGKAVFLVKRPDYVATPIKYLGSEMEATNTNYPRKQWSSFMVIQPSHMSWKRIKWNTVEPKYWQELGWLKDNEIGELDSSWNRVVDEGDPVEDAKIVHYTLGIPALCAYRNTPGNDLWFAEAREALHVCDKHWVEQIRTFVEIS